MDTHQIPWLQIRGPGDFGGVRKFIEKNKALGIEGYERMKDKRGDLAFMLGFQDELGVKYVAGIKTEIWEFGSHIEDRVRAALRMERT